MAKVKIEGNASGTGTFTIAAPNSNTDRTLTLPDEAGTVLTNDTASNVNFKGGDISFYEATGTTAKFFWDASAESLGIGTSSPNQSGFPSTDATVTIKSQTSGGAGNIELIGKGNSNGDIVGSIGFSSYAETNSLASIEGVRYTSDTQGSLVLKTSNTERMRIDSSGRVFIRNTTVPYSGTPGYLNVDSALGSGTYTITSIVNSTAGQGHINFVNNNGNVGSIDTSGSSTSYNTSSDYRLKEDWQPMSGSIDRLKALNPVNFAWKVDGSRVDGFLAHEAAEVVPEAVSGEKDAMRTEEYEVTPAVLDDDGNVVTEAVIGTREVPDYQGIDQAKLVPLLTAALQEAVSKIEALETRIAALEA